MTRNRRSWVPDQVSETLAVLRLPSSWSPHGGLAFTTRPGLQVATKLENRVAGWCALILKTPLGTRVQMTPPSIEDSCCSGSGMTSSLK